MNEAIHTGEITDSRDLGLFFKKYILVVTSPGQQGIFPLPLGP